jgi:hypothetical protein
MRCIARARAASFGRLVSILAILILGSCGKSGDFDNIGGSPPPVPGSKLFTADSGIHAISSLIDSNPSAGTIAADRTISGSNTGLAGLDVPAMALDPTKNLLYVMNALGIVVFADAGTADGNLSFARTPATAFAGNFSSLCLDTVHDRLYVGEDNTGVKVYDNASTLDLALPNRTLTGNFPAGFSVRGLAVDVGKNILYVAITTPTSNSILAFDNADTVNASVNPDRTISFAASADISILSDAANDRLYVSDPDGLIRVLDTASTRDGPAVVSRTIDLGLGAVMTKLALDSANDRLYAAAHASLIIVPNVGTANGSVMGTALLAPMGGDLSAVAVRP